jgi:hypothetical protein
MTRISASRQSDVNVCTRAGLFGLPPTPSARTRARLGHPVAPQAPQQRVRLHAGSSLRSFVAALRSAYRCACPGTVLSLQGPPVGQLPWPRRSGAAIAFAAGSVVRFAPQPSSLTRTQSAPPPHLPRPPAASFHPPPAGGPPLPSSIWPPPRSGQTTKVDRRVAASRPPLSASRCGTGGHVAAVAVPSRPLVVPPHSRPGLAQILRPKILIRKESCRRRSPAEDYRAIVRRWHPAGTRCEESLRHLVPAGGRFYFPKRGAQDSYRSLFALSLPSGLRGLRRLVPLQPGSVRWCGATRQPSCAIYPKDTTANLQPSRQYSHFCFAALRKSSSLRSCKHVSTAAPPVLPIGAGLNIFPAAGARMYWRRSVSAGSHRLEGLKITPQSSAPGRPRQTTSA